MTDVLKTNLDKIENIVSLYNKNKDNLYTIENAKKSGFTLKVNNLYMHSKYDPIKESLRVSDYLLTESDNLDVIILLGGGLGYTTEIIYNKILLNNKKKIKPYIIYIEADEKMFLTSLNVTNYSEMLNDDHFKCFLGAKKELIGSFIQSIPTQRIRYYYHRPSHSINKDYYTSIQNYISYVLDRKDMNTATFTRFQKLWTRNFIYNLPYFINSNSIKDLKNIAKNTTSAVIAGGPTLEYSLDYLKDNQNKIIIIAVDTTYKFLKSNNIKPDIVVTIDPQFWNYKYLENEELDDVIIITDSLAYHKVFSLAPVNNYFAANSIFPIANFFANNEDKGSLAAGGSVSTTAFDIARIIGSKEIILLGLDLGFPKNATHFRGAFFETNFLTFTNYFNTSEKNSYSYLAHAGLNKVEATNGSFIFSDPKMNLFKKWFEREINLTDAKVFLPDLGGSKIENAIITPFEKLPSIFFETKQNYFEQINIIKKNNRNNKTDYIKKITSFYKSLDKVKTISQSISSLIQDSGEISNNGISNIEKKEKQLYSNPETKDAANLISISAQDILLSIVENVKYDDNNSKSLWIKTKRLYESITELSNFYQKKISKLLKISS